MTRIDRFCARVRHIYGNTQTGVALVEVSFCLECLQIVYYHNGSPMPSGAQLYGPVFGIVTAVVAAVEEAGLKPEDVEATVRGKGQASFRLRRWGSNFGDCLNVKVLVGAVRELLGDRALEHVTVD